MMKKILPYLALALPLVLNLAHSKPTGATTDIKTLLLRQIDEERMAYRLYTQLGEEHPNMRPFQNIPHAEKRHFNALVDYTKAHFPGSTDGKLEGDFHFEATQTLYDKWLAEGKASPQAAAQVGVQLEQLDIADIDEVLVQKPEPALAQILNNLRRGSENHLAGFERQLAGGGGKDKGQGKGKMKGRANMPSCCAK